MPIRTATVGGKSVEVEIDYPVYYIIRHKETDAEPVAFIVIRNEAEDVGFSDGVALFLRKNFIIAKTTEAEAETYEAIGVAPIFNRDQLAEWVEDINIQIRKALAGGKLSEDKTIRCGDHVYDMGAVWDEFEERMW